MTELRERSPGPGWVCLGYDSRAKGTAWHRGLIRVLSSLRVDIELPDGSGTGPQWHVSISRSGKRPKQRDVHAALRAFGMLGAEQDNHHPGVAQHYFMPVDPAHRVACECKTTEDTVVEKDGYTWTNPRPETGESCRGCDFEKAHGKPCPLHGKAAHP